MRPRGVIGVRIGRSANASSYGAATRRRSGFRAELVELDETDRRRDVGQPEVVAKDLVVVALTHALIPVEPEPVRDLVVVRGDQSALAGRHVLGAVQAERTVPEASDPTTREFGTMCLTGVLDDSQPVTFARSP